MIAGIIVYLFRRSDKRIKSLSLVLSINIALYFLITACEDIPDVGDPRMFYRLQIIIQGKSELANNFGYAMETFNYIQVLFSIIILVILIILSLIRKRQS